MVVRLPVGSQVLEFGGGVGGGDRLGAVMPGVCQCLRKAPRGAKLQSNTRYSDGEASFPSAEQNPPMPTALRSGPYRVYFFSHEPNESPHVHVDRDDSSAKFWLVPVELVRNLGFSRHEIAELERLIMQNQPLLLEAWNEFFGT
jgi:hypothetical protein